MDTYDLLTKAESAGVVRQDSNSIHPTREFERQNEKYRQIEDPKDAPKWLEDRYSDVTGSDSPIQTVPSFFTEYMATNEFLADDDITEENRIILSIILNQFSPELPQSSGSPKIFLPIHGDRLRDIMHMFDRIVVYIWRDDCKPCDQIKNDFESLIHDESPGVFFVSVYGPEYAKYLYEEFDVVGGPTILFTEDGEIDMRIQGNYPQSAIRKALISYDIPINV